jgi:hypothetical protein
MQNLGHSMSTAFKRCAAALALTVILAPLALAQSPPTELSAVVGIVPPYVLQENGALTGCAGGLMARCSRCAKTVAVSSSITSGSAAHRPVRSWVSLQPNNASRCSSQTL